MYDIEYVTSTIFGYHAEIKKMIIGLTFKHNKCHYYFSFSKMQVSTTFIDNFSKNP
jgi:hypothetical protein